jgi:hypothetical protein
MRIIEEGTARWAMVSRTSALELGMKSSTRKRLSHARAALHVAALLVLLWNLASLGALVNGREAFVRAFEGGFPSPASRFGLGLALVIVSMLVEIAFVRGGLLVHRTQGIARLQLAAASLVIVVASILVLQLPLFSADLRVLHEAMRRTMGTPWMAGLVVAGLGALSLVVFQAVEASGDERRGRLFAHAGFLLALATFTLGLRALIPLVSGAPILPI